VLQHPQYERRPENMCVTNHVIMMFGIFCFQDFLSKRLNCFIMRRIFLLNSLHTITGRAFETEWSTTDSDWWRDKVWKIWIFTNGPGLGSTTFVQKTFAQWIGPQNWNTEYEEYEYEYEEARCSKITTFPLNRVPGNYPQTRRWRCDRNIINDLRKRRCCSSGFLIRFDFRLLSHFKIYWKIPDLNPDWNPLHA